MAIIFDTEFLLGTTRNNKLVFMDLSVRETNGVNTFCASFKTVQPVILHDELIKSSIESLIDNMSASEKFDILERTDSKPSELIEILENESYDIISDFFDNSLYSETITIFDEVNNDNYIEVFFESISGGQSSDWKYIDNYFIEKSHVEYMTSLWENKHLKEISPNELSELQVIYNHYKDYNIDTTIEEWVNKKYKDNELY